jgi:hypothetical protein
MGTYFIFALILLLTAGINIVAEKKLKQRWNLWLGYGIPAVCMIVFLWNVSYPRELFSDFNKAYYPAGRLILENPLALYDKNCAGGTGGGGTVCFVNIPIIALFFTPFSFFNLSVAQVLITLAGILSILLAIYLLFKLTEISGWRQIALVGLFVANGPLYYSLRQGNSTHFILPLLVGALFCFNKKREVWSGALLAIAALIKIPLFLFLVYFFLRLRWRVIGGFMGAIVGIAGLSMLLFGVHSHLVWFQECIQTFAGKPIGAYNVQSVDGFLVRLLTHDNLKNWQPVEVSGNFKVLRYALFSILIGATIWVCWRSKSPKTSQEENLEFSITLCLALIISPISWTHYYLFLLIPLSLYLGNKLAIPKGKSWFYIMVLSALLLSLPVTLVTINRPVLNLLMSKLLISHYVLGGILLVAILLVARWQVYKLSQLRQNKGNALA